MVLTLLTSMQWFYGPLWGSTLLLCDKRQVQRRGEPKRCLKWADVHARQLELLEVLRRNAMHPAVGEVHVIVGEAEPVQRFLRQLPWYQRRGHAMVHLAEVRKRPSFRTYMEYISRHLTGRTVVLTNQDIFLDDGWRGLAQRLPASTAYFVSRYHRRVAYDAHHSVAAGEALRYFNASDLPPSGAASGWLTPRRATAAADVGKRLCDMTTSSFRMWRRSLCSTLNFGSYDAYVLRLPTPLSAPVLDVFDFPQNAWGGENVFLYILQRALQLRVTNPCLALQAVHLHCELPTTFGARIVGDQRLGKKLVATTVQKKLRALGLEREAMRPEDIGKLTLNITDSLD